MAGNNQDDDDPRYKPFDPFESQKLKPTSTPAPVPSDEDKQTALNRALQAIKDRFTK